MSTEQGIIEGISGIKAEVRIQKSGACSRCSSRGACRSLSDSEMLIEVNNNLRAKEGDRVEITVPTRYLLKLSLLVYVLPIITLIIGAYLGREWAQYFQIHPHLASLFGGALAVGLTFYALKWVDRAAQGKSEYLPQMTRILSKASVQKSEA